MIVAAIETTYAGHRFRSRLEARWAVFFDALGIRWFYEPQGYEIGASGRYLPDFWLPDNATWVEVKGTLDKSGWDRLAAALWHLPVRPDDLPVGRWACSATPSLLLLGEIPSVDHASRALHIRFDLGVGADRLPEPVWSSTVFRSRGYLLDVGPKYRAGSVINPAPLLESNPSLDVLPDEAAAAAFDRARRARFEHGERG